MPISRAEILGKEPSFLKMAFTARLVKPGPDIEGDQLVHTVLVGGYPEMLRREDSRRRQPWARDYVKAIHPDLSADLSEVGKLPGLVGKYLEQARQLIQLFYFRDIPHIPLYVLSGSFHCRSYSGSPIQTTLTVS